MADLYGAATIPAAAPGAGQAVGDPALTYLLAFLQAFLQADGNVTTAWNAPGVAPNTPVVRTVHANNPAERDQLFRTNDLPALYLWRGPGVSKIDQVADYWRTETSNLTLLWVGPLTKREIASVRSTITNTIAKAVDVAIERGRTPSFLVAGDPDPQAATLGSFVHTFTRAVRCRVEGWKDAQIKVLTTDGSKGEPYTGVEIMLELVEKLDVDIGRYAPNGGTQITVTDPTPETLFIGKAP